MIQEIRLPVPTADATPSHLLLRLAEPPTRRAPDLCLVFLHGFASVQEGTKARAFREKAFADGLSFCTFDFQGHGESGGTMLDLTITRNLADIDAVLEFLRGRGYRRFVLIGSSMGGYTGLWYAARRPGAIAVGCHIAPGFDMAKGFLLWVGPEEAARWEREGTHRFTSEEFSVELGWQWIVDLRTYNDEWLLENYATPTLLFHGGRDETIPWRTTAKFAMQCRNGCVDAHLFGDGDHRLTDQRDEMWRLILEFMRAKGI